MEKEPVRVLVTGAAGQIGCALVHMIASGVMLGPDQPVILHMLGIPPAAEALNEVKKGLVDAAYPLLKGVVATTNVIEGCTGVNIAIMVGVLQKKEGMERKDVMSKTASIYESWASALGKHAAENCKVLVVADPANTIALILKEYAPSIPKKNITCLTRLDQNRALGQISERLNVPVSDVKNVIIWGYDSSTQYIDVSYATVKTPSGEKPVCELVADDAWLRGEFMATVQQRGAAIYKAGKQSSALSAASSVCDHIRDWILGTPEATWVSMGVYSDDLSYNVPAGLIHSFPVTCRSGEWTIVKGLNSYKPANDQQQEWTANSASQCPICLLNGGELERGEINCCDHYFHVSCIMTWSEVESRCPVCRRGFDKVAWLFNDANQGNVNVNVIVDIAARDQVCLVNNANQGNVNVIVDIPRDQSNAATLQPTDGWGTGDQSANTIQALRRRHLSASGLSDSSRYYY